MLHQRPHEVVGSILFAFVLVVFDDLPAPKRCHAANMSLLGFLNGSAIIFMTVIWRGYCVCLDNVDLNSVTQSEFRAIPSQMLVRG